MDMVGSCNLTWKWSLRKSGKKNGRKAMSEEGVPQNFQN